MSKLYSIRALYEYEAEVEAGSKDEAYALFLNNLNAHYVGTDELDIEEQEGDDEPLVESVVRQIGMEVREMR